MRLTVIIRDPSPLIFLGDSINHRRVTFDLTKKQTDKLALRYKGRNGKYEVYEEYSICFLETEEE